MQTERNLMKAIKELQDKNSYNGCPSRETLKNCDKIIHIENGKINIKIIQQKLKNN